MSPRRHTNRDGFSPEDVTGIMKTEFALVNTQGRIVTKVKTRSRADSAGRKREDILTVAEGEQSRPKRCSGKK